MNQKTRVATQLHEKLRRPGGSGACQESWVAAIWYWNPSWASSVWGEKWLSQDGGAPLPSVSWPRQVDSSSRRCRSPTPSETSGLTGPRDGGPLVCVRSIFTTAAFPWASACRQERRTDSVKTQETHCFLFVFSVACRSKGIKVTLLYFPKGAMWRKRWRSGRSDSDLISLSFTELNTDLRKRNFWGAFTQQIKNNNKKSCWCYSDIRFSLIVILPFMLYCVHPCVRKDEKTVQHALP